MLRSLIWSRAVLLSGISPRSTGEVDKMAEMVLEVERVTRAMTALPTDQRTALVARGLRVLRTSRRTVSAWDDGPKAKRPKMVVTFLII